MNSRKLISTLAAIITILGLVTVVAILTPHVITWQLVAQAIAIIGGLGGFHVAHQASIDRVDADMLRRTGPPPS